MKRILRKYGYDYTPDLQEAATRTVLEQAGLLAADWAAYDPIRSRQDARAKDPKGMQNPLGLLFFFRDTVITAIPLSAPGNS
jgi:hypothetical protein